MSREKDSIDRMVDDYVHDLLSPEDRKKVEDLCANDPHVAKLLEQAKARLGLLQSLPSVEPSAQLVPETMAKVDEEARKPRPFRKVFSFASSFALAAAFLLLLGYQWHVASLRATTIDVALLGQRELLTTSNASLRVRVIDFAKNAEPLAGVPVTISLLTPNGEPKRLAQATTDETGSIAPRFVVPDLPSGEYSLSITADTPKGPETITRPIQLKRSWKLMLSSDKPVYQPGQKILLRALALRRPDLKPVANEPAVFTLTDPRGNVLFKHRKPTSVFGISSAECELDREIAEGSYSLACKVGDTESKIQVEIKPYVLPKFKVDLSTDRPWYDHSHNTAIVSIDANTFFGKPVARATVQVYSSAGGHTSRVTSETDEQGKAKVEVALARFGEVKLTASVTDTAGQEIVRSISRVKSPKPVKLEILPEGGTLVRGVDNRVWLMLTLPDGTPAPNRTIAIKGLWIDLTVRTDERGVASFLLTNVGDTLDCTAKVSDGQGPIAEFKHTFSVGAFAEDYLVRTNKVVYKAGESMTFTAFGSGSEPIFIDLVKDGQTMVSGKIAMSEGQGETTIDLTPELVGAVEVVSYRFMTATGQPLHKRRVIYVADAQQLKINASLDAKEYRPGGKANLGLSLVDAKGKRTPGAISLVAVDEAVFSVMTSRPGSEQQYFQFDPAALAVAVERNWSPQQPRSTRDDATFAAAVQSFGSNANPNARGGSALQRGITQLAPVDRHTLAVRTLPDRERTVAADRQIGFARVRLALVIWILATMLSSYIAFWLWVPTWIVLRIHFWGGVTLLPLGVLAVLLIGTEAHMTFKGAMLMAPGGMDMAAFKEAKKGGDDFGFEAPRVRRQFPETLLWLPELISDEEGNFAPLPIELADSITTWRLSASAVSREGLLGSTQLPIKVFQPFFVDVNLPVSLTQGDEVAVPVVVYNYLDRPQSVELTLSVEPWFTLSENAKQTIELAANEVKSTRYRIKVNKAGTQKMTVQALAKEASDAIERSIEIVPSGRRVEVPFSGSLAKDVLHTLDVPADAVEGSLRAYVKFYPSGLSQLVEGLDSIFQMPNGCFEQTSSTTYPNVLALDYLRQNNIANRVIEEKAKQYIHLGYQRLVGFEVRGGGFDWYGNPPANVPLTAYGLMEFVDMAKVHEVDPNLIERTRAWLLSKRAANGTWPPDHRGAHLAGRTQEDPQLPLTAYVAWAVYSGHLDPSAYSTRDWLLRHRPEDIKNPHTLALVCNALLAIDAQHQSNAGYLAQLVKLAKVEADKGLTSWAQDATTQTVFYGGGISGQCETTALAVLALQKSKSYPGEVLGGLRWLLANKDARGTWHSTQATILALKALIEGSRKPENEAARELELQIAGITKKVTIAADQSDVLKMVDITEQIKPGANLLSLREKTKDGTNYQVVLRYHVPEKIEKTEAPFVVTQNYDRTEANLGQSFGITTIVENRQATDAPMVMVELPIPPGSTVDTNVFTKMQQEQKIGKWQVRSGTVLLYLRNLEAGQKFQVRYTAQPTTAMRATTPGVRVYEYYNPTKQAQSESVLLTVR
jgi:uncharacterized protein YfaS (alpha-2-macroglobulin family)